MIALTRIFKQEDGKMKNALITCSICFMILMAIIIIRVDFNKPNIPTVEVDAEEDDSSVEYDVMLTDIECCVEYVMLDTNLTSKRYDRESGSIHDTSTYLVDFVDKDGNKYTQDFTGEIMFGEGDNVLVDIGLILDENDNIISYDINNVRLKENHSSI